MKLSHPLQFLSRSPVGVRSDAEVDWKCPLKETEDTAR